MDYNPYNRNNISQNDFYQQKLTMLKGTNDLMFGNSLRYSYNPNNMNNNYFNNQNNLSKIDNRKDNQLFMSQNNPTNNYNLNNQSPYLIYLPISPVQNTLPINSSDINSNISDYSFFGLESKKKEEQKYLEKLEYRKELLEQIKEKKRINEEKKKKMEEEEKNEIRKNEEYFQLKKKQADEQARKLREKIARRMQRQQNDDFGYTSHILEISKDFENMNKSRQGTSLVNNIELNRNKNEFEIDKNDNIIDLENYDDDNIFGIANNNILLEKDNYMKEIDNEFNILCDSLKSDIDLMINRGKNEDPNIKEILDGYDISSNLTKKEQQYAEYILGKTLSPPSPFKLSENPLSYSFYKKQNKLMIDNRQRIKDENREINLDEYFNQDIVLENVDKKDIIKTKDIKNKIEKDYFDIFENINEANIYTKKYNKDTNSQENISLSFTSNITQTNFDNKSNKETKNKFYPSYQISNFNTSLSNSLHEKLGNKIDEQDDEYPINIEDSSLRKSENKNKILLDKKLINIKENKEDEEDEEEDEKNKKTKEEKKSDNKEGIKKKKKIEKNDNNINNEEKENEEGEEIEDVEGKLD